MIEALPKRILDKIEVGEPDECWRWTAAKQSMGYPMVVWQGKPRVATRVIYEIINSVELNRQDYICHTCDRPDCVNPSHLFLGTQKTNMVDCKEKGRTYRGEGHNFAKLTADDVRAIRASREKSGDLAIAYGVTRHTIAHIRLGKTWSDLPGGPSVIVPKVRAHLTKEQVLVIRESHSRAVDLAEAFGVSPQAIWAIRSGKTWQSLK